MGTVGAAIGVEAEAMVSVVSQHPRSIATSSPSNPVELRPLIVAAAGRPWLDDQFAAIRKHAESNRSGEGQSFLRWLDYKHRSAVLSPETWLALYAGGQPVGLVQGSSVVRVLHLHFLAVSSQAAALIAPILFRVAEFAGRRRCHTISVEGPHPGALVRILGPQHLEADGYVWHERSHLGISLDGREVGRTEDRVGPLDLSPNTVLRLMKLEADAFVHAACDHPGELPSDLTDGYRTSLLPMQNLSAMFREEDGAILGALYAEGKGRVAWIHSLFVDPASRHRGVARRLLDYCLDRHAEEGFSRSELSVLAANGPAVRLYAAAGFQEVKRTDLFIKKL